MADTPFSLIMDALASLNTVHDKVSAAIVLLTPPPPPPVIPPPTTPTLTATDIGGGHVKVQWGNIVPNIIGRTGKDASGWPADPRDGWTTNDDGFGGVSADIVKGGGFTFTGMADGIQHTYFVVDVLGKRVETTLTVEPVVVTPPPVTPPVILPGTMKIGVFNYGNPQGPATLSGRIGHPVKVIGYFERILGGAHQLNDQFVPFLSADRGNVLDTCLQPIDFAGNWPGFNGNPAPIVDAARAWAQHMKDLGIAAQVLARIMGEVNAPWFGWGGNPEWYRYVAGLMVDAIKSVAPEIRCMMNVVPGRAGSPHPNAGTGESADPAAFWIDKLDGVSMDHYLWVLYGATSTDKANEYFQASQSDIWAAQWAKDRGKEWVISETALTKPGGPVTGESGDDGVLLRLVLDGLVGRWTSTSGPVVQPPSHWLYEDVPDGNVGMTLDDAPNGVEAIKEFATTLVG